MSPSGSWQAPHPLSPPHAPTLQRPQGRGVRRKFGWARPSPARRGSLGNLPSACPQAVLAGPGPRPPQTGPTRTFSPWVLRDNFNPLPPQEFMHTHTHTHTLTHTHNRADTHPKRCSDVATHTWRRHERWRTQSLGRRTPPRGTFWRIDFSRKVYQPKL